MKSIGTERIRGSHSGNYDNHDLQGCDSVALWVVTNVSKKHIPSTFYVAPKHWYPPTRPHSVTTKTTNDKSSEEFEMYNITRKFVTMQLHTYKAK
jgi:hypothetical protein